MALTNLLQRPMQCNFSQSSILKPIVSIEIYMADIVTKLAIYVLFTDFRE